MCLDLGHWTLRNDGLTMHLRDVTALSSRMRIGGQSEQVSRNQEASMYETNQNECRIGTKKRLPLQEGIGNAVGSIVILRLFGQLSKTR